MKRLCGALGICAVLGTGSSTFAQSLGTVKSKSARVQGAITVSAGNVSIQNNATVMAGLQTVEVSLTRGGLVNVCLGSAVGLSQAASGAAGKDRPLLFALQRGAAEILTSLQRTDAVITPDLRIESSDSAPLDLHLRINDAGDTCVENLGKNAPILHVTEQLSGAGYLVKPGQHVVFEKGSVRAVVNRATTECGCPHTRKDDDFPEAESAGLVPSTVPAAAVGEPHVQVSTGMDYSGKTGTVSGPPLPDGTVPVTSSGGSAAPQTAPVVASTNPGKPKSRSAFRKMVHWIHKTFGED